MSWFDWLLQISLITIRNAELSDYLCFSILNRGLTGCLTFVLHVKQCMYFTDCLLLYCQYWNNIFECLTFECLATLPEKAQHINSGLFKQVEEIPSNSLWIYFDSKSNNNTRIPVDNCSRSSVSSRFSYPNTICNHLPNTCFQNELPTICYPPRR